MFKISIIPSSIDSSGLKSYCFSPFQIETILTTYSNLIDPEVYDASSLNNKEQLIKALESLTPSLCKNYVAGEAPGVVKNKLVVLQTVVKDFSGSIGSISLGCSDCPTNMAAQDEVTFGSSIKDSYDSYACGSGKTCTGACISSWQVKLAN